MSLGADLVLPGSGVPGKIAGYRLEGHIGRGDMTVVRLAQDERLDRKVAIKVLAPELALDAAFRARLLDQVRAAAEMDHPHILPVYEAGDVAGIVYVAMRYVQGGDARSLLSPLGLLPFARAWKVIAQVASALDAAHAHGVIHRDVKPANILLDASSGIGGRTPDGADGCGSDYVYLSDFGMRRDWSPGDIIAAARLGGTLDYVAPEQIEGRTLDGRADLYSLACAGFELLCGTPPFGQDQGLTVLYAQLYAPPPTARRGALTCPRRSTWCWPRRLRRTRQTVTRPVASSPKNCARRWASFAAGQTTPHGRAHKATPGHLQNPRWPPAASDLPSSRNLSTGPRSPQHPCHPGLVGHRPPKASVRPDRAG